MNRDAITTFLLGVWALMFTHTVKAATLNEFLGSYDAQLIQWAAGTALLGGILRTILSLQSDKRIVNHILIEALWDMLKALVAGMLAFVLIQALRASGYAIPSEVRFAAILVAGAARMSAIDWMKEALMTWLDHKKNLITGKTEPQPPKE